MNITKKNMKNRSKDIKKNKTIVLLIALISILSCTQNNDSHENDIIFTDAILDDSIREIGMMLDTLKQGFWIEIDTNGIVLKTKFYLDGELIGPYKMFYKNGSPRFEVYFKNGEFEGRRVTYYSNGQIKDEGYFKDGKQDSTWTFYIEDGRIDKKIRFKDGEQVEIIIDNKLVPLPPMPPKPH